MATTNLEVQVLQVSADADDESELRILVGGEFTKYLTIDAGIYEVDDICFAPALIPLLPPLPYGDWNVGRISKDPRNGRPFFATAARVSLPKITNIWHTSRMDHLELSMGRKLRSNVYQATSPRFGSTIVTKFARFSWEVPYLDSETSAYEWVDGYQIGPKFLGHLTEEGRVIGFLIELIPDCRHATPADLSLCQHTLARLHKLGVKHGDINKHNFLIHQGKAILIDFDCAVLCDDLKLLADEFGMLEQQLRDPSGKGGVLVG